MATLARIAVQPIGDGPLRIEKVNIPDPEPSQVLIKQYASGVCHSQIHQMHFSRKQPVLLGHESTGIVMKIGSDVQRVKEGDTVIVTWMPQLASKSEKPASSVQLNVSDGIAMAWEGVFTWGTHTLVDEQFVVKVNSDIKRDVSAIIGCAVMTGAGAVLNTGNVQSDESVAVFGVGGVGLSAIVAAKMREAKMIIGVDLDDQKLEFAKRFGATHVINATLEDPVHAIRKLTIQEGTSDLFGYPVHGVDYAFDCIGVNKTIDQIIHACRSGQFGIRNGGKAILVGIPSSKVELNALDMLIHEKKFIGSLGGSCVPDRDFPLFIDWARKGILDLDSMVTTRYSLDQINEAISDLSNGKIFGRAIIDFSF